MKKMIKRKDGSYSQRGLWDNIRANKGSGKKPTKDMLKQESKIKKEENMNSMYKKGGKKTSKKKVMKEAKMEGESFIQENKELSFGAPQMKKFGGKKYNNGGPGEETYTKKGLFRDTTTTYIGDDSNYSYSRVKRDKKGNVRSKVEGNYMEDNDVNSPTFLDYMDTGTKTTYNKKGEIKKSKIFDDSFSYDDTFPTERKKGGMKYGNGGPIKGTSKMPDPALPEKPQLTAEQRAEIEKIIMQTKKPSKNTELNPSDAKKTYENGYSVKKRNGGKSMAPGGGGRFAALVGKLKSKGKSEESAKAIAASVGRKKYGKSRFQEMAAAGKKRMGGKKC